MTNKQLDAIRDRVETAHRNPGCCSTRVANDLRILLDEVERLASDLAMARQVSGELCEACGWAMKFPGEPCRCELLKWRDEWEVFKTHTMEQGTSSFARGAEAMRTALLQRVSWGSDLADRIRTEPVPENK